MKSPSRLLAVLATLAAVPAFAAVDGAVVNGTTGKPQAGVQVSLVQPSQSGMNSLASMKTGPDGAFHFTQSGSGMGPLLVQADFEGVTYTKALPPGAPTSGIQLDIYNSTTKADTAQVSQDLFLYQPTDSQVTVNESIFFENATKLAYTNTKNGTLRFYLPPGANGAVNVNVTPPGGMPISQTAEKTSEKDVYSIDYAIRPGETRFDLTYSFPATQPLVVEGKILHKAGATRIAVPPGVTLQSDDVTPLGQEPQTKAMIYDVKGQSYKIQLAGAMGSPDDADSGAPQITEIKPLVYNRLGWILGIALTILALGFILLYRSEKSAPEEISTDAADEAKPVRKGAVSR